ncbi:hypothetical protein [Paraburkholderia sp.]|jgi:hypothetical protein|uniref:hypothetical protein n=1 Tax=Paraburkholderia sp. TaxID=1926495 RepID=UPI002F41C275
MLNPIFADTTVALHMSYAIRATRATAPTSMRRMLLMLMESAQMMNRQQTGWLERLIGQRSRLVDFGSLNAVEIHAQAVMITEAVRHRLPEPEAFALIARFAQDIEKSAGVYGVTDYLLVSGSPVGNREAVTDLVWRRYLPRQYRGGYSIRDIEYRTHVARSTLGRAAQWLDDECDGLELSALRRLEQTFVPHGVCGALVMQA